MAKKGVAQKIRLVSTGKNVKGESTGYTYYTRKGKNVTEKLALKKYDPRAVHPDTGKVGCHVLFEEKKLPSPKKN